MSTTVSLYYWNNESLGRTQLLVIQALAERCNDDGWCFPSIGEIARRCRLSERGVQKIIAKLVDVGQLAVDANQGMRVSRGSPTHRYNLLAYQRSIGLMPTPEKGELSNERVNFDAQKDERIGSPIAEQKGELFNERVNFSPEKGERIGSPEPSIEPPIEPSDEKTVRAQPTNASSSSSAPPIGLRLEPPAPQPNGDYRTAVASYEQNIGLTTAIISENIKAAISTYPPGWIPMAIERAVKQEKRSWAYVEGILKNWEREGFNNGQSRKSTAKTGHTSSGAADSPKPWANYQPAEYDAAFAAELNGD